jgi:tetratricopeptide (TPR) repeat protein
MSEVRSLSHALTAFARQGAVAEAARAADALLGVDDAALAAGDPAVVRDLLDAAGALTETGDLPRAGSLLIKGVNALAGNPRATQVDLVIPLNNLMAVYDRMGDAAQRDQVAAYLAGLAQTIEEPLPRNAMMVFLQLGRIYHDVGATEIALVMYRQVHRYMTTHDEPDTLLGWLLLYAGVAQAGGDIPAAREALERAVRIEDPVDQAAAGTACHNLALLYLELGEQYERAEQLVGRALEIVLRTGRAGSAEHAGELAHLGVIAHRRGDLGAAEQHYLEAIEVYERAPDTKPADFSDFLTSLGLLRLNGGRPGEAVAPFRRAAELRSSAADEGTARRADALSNLATALFEAGEPLAAGREFERAVDLRLQH